MACSLSTLHGSLGRVQTSSSCYSGQARAALSTHLTQQRYGTPMSSFKSCANAISFAKNCRLQRLLIVNSATTGSPSSPPPPGSPPGLAPRKPGNNKKVGSVPILGTIQQNLSNGKFRVKLVNGVTVIAHLSGKIRKNKIKIAVGDEVTVELSAYDLTRGRISRRH